VAEPSVTDIENPEPASLLGKLPFGKCLKSSVKLYVRLS
jgi:hypothetical protein